MDKALQDLQEAAKKVTNKEVKPAFRTSSPTSKFATSRTRTTQMSAEDFQVTGHLHPWPGLNDICGFRSGIPAK